MKNISAFALLIVGIIHLLPVSGVFGGVQLSRLYGVTVSDPNAAILLQHRAVLFFILGALMISAIPFGSLRIAAFLVGLASAVSFIVVALWVGGYGMEINRVVIADFIAVLFLMVGFAFEIFNNFNMRE